MKIESIVTIKKELKHLTQEELLELCLRLGKFKKENKALLTYLLFEAHDEDGYIASVKTTLDELFEILTWGQLKLHAKPVGILNIGGYYNHLLAHIQNVADSKFMQPSNLGLVISDDNLESLLAKMENFAQPTTDKWVK